MDKDDQFQQSKVGILNNFCLDMITNCIPFLKRMPHIFPNSEQNNSQYEEKIYLQKNKYAQIDNEEIGINTNQILENQGQKLRKKNQKKQKDFLIEEDKIKSKKEIELDVRSQQILLILFDIKGIRKQLNV